MELPTRGGVHEVEGKEKSLNIAGPARFAFEEHIKNVVASDSIFPPVVAGFTEVEGKENLLKIDGFARFAVEEHNKKENAMLQFVKVLNAKEQTVAGGLYYITIEATDGGVKKVYEAKVWVKPWMNFKEVIEFKPVEVEDTASREAKAKVWLREWKKFKEVQEFKPVGDTAPGKAGA